MVIYLLFIDHPFFLPFSARRLRGSISKDPNNNNNNGNGNDGANSNGNAAEDFDEEKFMENFDSLDVFDDRLETAKNEVTHNTHSLIDMFSWYSYPAHNTEAEIGS